MALQLPVHKGRFIHWSDNHYGCRDQVEQLRGSELSKRDKQTFCECIRAGKGEKTLIWMLPLSEGEGFTAQFSARCTRLFNWYDTSWKRAAALIGSYLSNKQLKGRTWRVNTIFSTHRPYLLAHMPNSLRGGKGERKERGKKREKCVRTRQLQTQLSTATHLPARGSLMEAGSRDCCFRKGMPWTRGSHSTCMVPKPAWRAETELTLQSTQGQGWWKRQDAPVADAQSPLQLSLPHAALMHSILLGSYSMQRMKEGICNSVISAEPHNSEEILLIQSKR